MYVKTFFNRNGTLVLETQRYVFAPGAFLFFFSGGDLVIKTIHVSSLKRQWHLCIRSKLAHALYEHLGDVPLEHQCGKHMLAEQTHTNSKSSSQSASGGKSIPHSGWFKNLENMIWNAYTIKSVLKETCVGPADPQKSSPSVEINNREHLITLGKYERWHWWGCLSPTKPLRVAVTTLTARRTTSVPQGQSATVARHKTAEDAGHRMWPRTEGIHLTSKCHGFNNRLQTVGRCWHKRVYFVWSNVWVGSVAQRMSTWIPRNSVFDIIDKFFF